ncbi:hypothetical protein [Nocardioides ferulae]|uniref:hypothetical protein n=1 Tax=Nocardioides ferulae TaxID=2340821 RepID=UPI000EB1369B|nr:hypothetical protein [Nocardioides ferulae]
MTASGLLATRRSWSSLAVPDPADLVGDLAASFLPPLRRVAPAGLGLVGLPRWWGKRFVLAGDGLDGVNLVRPRDGGVLAEVLPMTARVAPSLADGRPALVVSYAADAPRPWRWVRDELRTRPDGTIVGLTFVDLPVLRRLGGTPFLLSRGPG